MKKTCRRTAFFRSISWLAAVSVLSLTTTGFAYTENESTEKVVGINLTGDFEFNNLSLVGFTSQPVDITGRMTSTFISINNGVATAHLPLITFGKNIEYPGVLYSQGDNQFVDLVANAASGDTESRAKVWPYLAGGAVLVVGIAAAIDDDNADSGSDASDAAVVCPEGYAFINGECQRPSFPTTCPSGTTLVGDTCVVKDGGFVVSKPTEPLPELP